MNNNQNMQSNWMKQTIWVIAASFLIHVQACAASKSEAKKPLVNDSLQSKIDSFYQNKFNLYQQEQIKTEICEEIQSHINTYNRLANINNNYKTVLKSIDSQVAKQKNKSDSLFIFKSKIQKTIQENDSNIIYLKRLVNIQKKEEKAIKEIISKLESKSNGIKISIKQLVTQLNGPINIRLNGGTINCFIVDPKIYCINTHLINPKGDYFHTFSALDAYFKSKKDSCEMITNAGMFEPNYQPVGLYIEAAKKVKNRLNTDTFYNSDNFHLYPNGIFFIDSNTIPCIKTTKAFRTLDSAYVKKIKIATQSGPMLIIDKTIHPKFSKISANDKIRSGVGIMQGNKVVFACTEYPETFYNFADFLKTIFSCDNALFLDGAISKMYLKGYNQPDGIMHFGPMISITKLKK
jgi:uncharacterized protein YigE (DUF2233 family)